MKTIKWKMAILYMILVVMVMTGCGAFMLWNLRNNAYQGVFREMEYTAQRIVDVFSTADLPEDTAPQTVIGDIVTSLLMESVSTDIMVCLLSADGELLYTREQQLSQSDLASRAIIDARSDAKMEDLYIHTVDTGERVGDYAMRFVLPQNETPYILFIRQSMTAVQDSMRSASYIIIISMFLGIVVAGALGYFLAVNISRPILRLTRKTQQLTSGNLEAAANMQPADPEQSGDELARLEQHFDSMAHELSGMILELQQMERMQKEFVANVSHELRTPITTVKSYVETLLDSGMDDAKLRQHFLEVVDQEADRMAALIADLLELSRIDSHQVQLIQEPVELGSLLRDNLERCMLQAGSRGQHIEWASDMETLPMADAASLPALPETFWVQGSTRRIEQVLQNLLTNAMKYSPDGALVEAGIYRHPGEIWVMIRDNGMGISPEDQKRIFERFYRVDKARSRSMGGTGLGLAIAREIMVLHGGRIWV